MNIRRLVAAAAVVLLGCSDATGTAPLLGLSESGPRLLACPNSIPLTTTFVADPLLGGSVSLAGTSVTVPSGAVSVPTVFVVTIPASPYMKVDVHAEGLTSFLFNSPATISIDYSRCGARTDNKALQVWYVSLTDDLLENMNAIDDRAAQRITFTTGHLSGYSVAW